MTNRENLAFREGDTVIVDYPDYEPMRAVVVDTDPVSFDYRVEYEDGRPDTVLKKYIRGYPNSCKIHKTRTVYHDKEEKWICPFCYEE